MQTAQLKPSSAKNKIRRCLDSMEIHWTPIEKIPELLEAKYHYDFDPKMVDEVIRNSQRNRFTLAWSSGGKHLMVSNQANVNDFENAA